MMAKEKRVEGTGFFIKAHTQELGDRARLGSVVERHHKDAHEDHRWDRANPVKLAGDDAVLCPGSSHANHLLGT